MTKYGAKKIVVDNIRFDSKAEAKYYMYLKSEKQAGRIADIKLQPEFKLLPTFRKNGTTFRSIVYIADFLVTYPDGRQEVIDVKGYRTSEFNMKRKLFEHKYPELWINEVSV